MKGIRCITLSVVLLLSLGINAQSAMHSLRIMQQRQGFSISKVIEGQEVLLAYSEHGNFDKAIGTDSLFRQILSNFDRQKHLQGSRIRISSKLPDAVAPLCTDIWNQYAPYYNLTPTIDSTQCMTGCVGLAMAQVMYYYRHPEQGKGTHTYFDEKGCKDTLTANFAGHKYDWDYMLNTYEGIDYSERQAQAVALLHSDCGISVETRYGITSSGARSAKQPHALYNYFGYDSGMRMVFRDLYSHSEIHELIQTELAANRPVLCSAHGKDGGGHAFVIDGYDQEGLYHIRWGWGGWCDGYYNIDYMNPDQPEWNHHRDRRENGMNIYQSFTVGIQPDLGNSEGTPTSHESHEYAFSYLKINQTEDSLAVHNLCNIGWNQHQGQVILGLTGVENEDLVCAVYDYNRNFLLEEIDDTVYTDTIALADIIPQTSTLPDGTYRLMPMYEEANGWKRARTSCGTPYYIYIEKQGEKVSWRQPSQETSSTLKLVDFQIADTLTRRGYEPITLTLQNNSDTEYCGQVFIVYDTEQTPSIFQMLTRVGLYLEPNSSETIDFKYVYLNGWMPDTIRVHVLYATDLFTDSLVIFDERKEVILQDKANSILALKADSANRERTYNLKGQSNGSQLQKGINITRRKKLLVR